MTDSRPRKHRAETTANQTHARAGLTALAAVVTVITVVLVAVGSVFASSGASPSGTLAAPVTVTATKTVTATVTAPGPTSTVTVPGPTSTVTATKTVTAPAATAPGATPTSPTATWTTTATSTATPGVTTLSDFNDHSAGLYVPSGELLGAGIDRTIYRPAPHASNKTAPTSGTNQLKLIRAGGMSQYTAATVDLGGFTLQGTDQSPSLTSYGGIVVGYGIGSRVHDVKVNGIPGYDSKPPGETFSLAMFHSDSSHLNRVTLDGFRQADGSQVGATLLGYNYTTGKNTINNLHANHSRYGFGLAMFQTAGTYTFHNCDFSSNRKGINIEQSIGGTVYNFNHCDFRGIGAPYVAQVSSINSSSKVYIRNPVVDSWPLKVNTYPSSTRSKQLDSDIHLIINGVDVSKDPSKLKITHM